MQTIVGLVVGGFLLLFVIGLLRAILGDAALMLIGAIVAFAALVKYARVHPGWLLLITLVILVVGGFLGLFVK